MVRAGNFADAGGRRSHVAFSTDSGANWFQGTEPGGVNGAARSPRPRTAAGSCGRRAGAPVSLGGLRNSWSPSPGIPTGAVVESDRVNPKKFYGFAGGRFYVRPTAGLLHGDRGDRAADVGTA